MKMIYGGVPVNSLKVKHYEVSTNDATLKASDLQAGVTAYARGQKVTGTGKSFEFANYGMTFTNFPILIPTEINVIEIASLIYPIKTTIAFADMKNVDFSTNLNIGSVIVDGVEYPISLTITSGFLQLNCEKDINLEVFYGKDNYI